MCYPKDPLWNRVDGIFETYSYVVVYLKNDTFQNFCFAKFLPLSFVILALKDCYFQIKLMLAIMLLDK